MKKCWIVGRFRARSEEEEGVEYKGEGRRTLDQKKAPEQLEER